MTMRLQRNTRLAALYHLMVVRQAQDKRYGNYYEMLFRQVLCRNLLTLHIRSYPHHRPKKQSIPSGTLSHLVLTNTCPIMYAQMRRGNEFEDMFASSIILYCGCHPAFLLHTSLAHQGIKKNKVSIEAMTPRGDLSGNLTPFYFRLCAIFNPAEEERERYVPLCLTADMFETC